MNSGSLYTLVFGIVALLMLKRTIKICAYTLLDYTLSIDMFHQVSIWFHINTVRDDQHTLYSLVYPDRHLYWLCPPKR